MLESMIKKINLNSVNLNGFCFTMDVDWASEFVVSQVIEQFNSMGIPLTVFMTHPSPFLINQIEKGNIDGGIHPNFIQPSSQGNSMNDIIEYCMKIVPGVETFRCHRWYAVNDIYEKLYQNGLRYDSNLCTLLNVVSPFLHRSGMISFPVFWEDGAYLYHKLDLNFNNVRMLFSQYGLKVINIHPMHFLLNTPYFQYMRDIKDKLPRDEWISMEYRNVEKYRNFEIGIGDFTKSLINFALEEKHNIYTLKQLYGIVMH